MKWDEFCDLLSGLSSDTPLGRIVTIRSEEDPAVLTHFTPEQHRIRNRWRSRLAREKTPQEVADFLGQMQTMFARMAGAGGGVNE